MTATGNGLRAKKLNYIVEPIKEGYSNKWEGHHATNPCSVRLSCDPSRVFLGYRAGGVDDYYRYAQYDVWSSHLGLMVLDESGMKPLHRFPLPIITKVLDVELPKTEQQYEVFLKEHGTEILFLHDFRFFEHEGYLNVIFHEGPINDCFDCIVRMKVSDFLKKIEQSIKLMAEPVEQMKDRWHKLWWADGVWEPCGLDGTNRIFASPVVKGDIVYFVLGDGTLQMCHRPLSDGMAVLNTGKDLFVRATPDGITKYGTFETCIRPGRLDNSHIGSNGLPIRAKIGNVDVYIDVTHGCFNRMLSEEGLEQNDIFYYAYFRVKDAQTGELLYYSEEPILDYDDVWKEYAEHGEWVSINKALGGVMFTGGQTEVVPGKNGLDDQFAAYVGLGDTAVALATFKLRDLLPQQVLDDIITRKQHQKYSAEKIQANTYMLEKKVSGWDWAVENDTRKRHINVVRTLKKADYTETDARAIGTVCGNFDADAVMFDGKSIRFVEKIGWILVYKGVRWDEISGKKVSKVGYGLIVLAEHNPELVLYRSNKPLDGYITILDGWTLGLDVDNSCRYIDSAYDLLPEKVVFELKRRYYLRDKGLLFPSQMIAWHQQKSGMIEKGAKPKLP